MANTILTPTMVTREALMILHQKLTFVGAITRDYDDSYAKSGAKIGDTLKIRLPNQYVVRSGSTLTTQDTAETSVSLQIATQKGVDLNFTSTDLTLSLDEFSKRILQPAMAVLAAAIESDALNNMVKDVYNQVNNIGTGATLVKLLGARKQLMDNLAPPDNRNVVLNTQDNVDLVSVLSTLFQDQGSLAKQYKEGYLGRTSGLDFAENTYLTKFTSGTDANAYTVNGASQTGANVLVTTGTGTFKRGDIVTLAGCNRCHPETKADTGALQQFVITADVAANATTIPISPSIVTTGATQNVIASPTSGGAVTKAAGNGVTHGISLAFQQGAFAFATADLVMPEGVDFAARRVQDGVSMRIVRQYDINNDKFPCRLDVLYGYKTIRPQLASRMANN